jgi:GNAT superfamily N-acetyltransferase
MKTENQLILKHLTKKEELLLTYPLLVTEYPSMTRKDYERQLDEMLPANYGQVAVFEGAECLGVNGYWINNKLWCGRYLELDNIVVSPTHRSKGIGKMMMNYLENLALEKDCTMLALDSYTTNFKAHKLFYNQGYIPRGFHFIKFLTDTETDANGYKVK